MSLILTDIKAIVFDLGNTLVEFGPRQVKYINEAREQALLKMFGSCDLERLITIRDKQLTAPYRNGLKRMI